MDGFAPIEYMEPFVNQESDARPAIANAVVNNAV